MNNFYNILLKAISDYKIIIRKNLSTTKGSAKIRELGIKRTCIKNIDEAGLYKIGLNIIKELKLQIGDNNTDNKKTNNFYNGADEFLQYLEFVFSQYRLEKNKVVHVGQKSSCALVSAIQLITMSKGSLTPETINQIKRYSTVVIAHGNEEQKKMLISTIGMNSALPADLIQV